MLKRLDIGWCWAWLMAVWGQLGIVLGMFQFPSVMAVLYAVTIEPKYHLPVWVYVSLLAGSIISAILFIKFVGISGYYRFFNNNSEVHEVNQMLKFMLEKGNQQKEFEAWKQSHSGNGR